MLGKVRVFPSKSIQRVWEFFHKFFFPECKNRVRTNFCDDFKVDSILSSYPSTISPWPGLAEMYLCFENRISSDFPSKINPRKCVRAEFAATSFEN